VESAVLLPALLPCLHVACVAGSGSTYGFQLLRVYLQSSIICTRSSYTRLSYCMSNLYHNRPYVVLATYQFASDLTFQRIFYNFRNFRSYLHRSTSHVRHVHNLAPSHPALRLHSVTCIQPATDGEQILNITMQGSPRSSYESRPPPGHLLAQPRQSGSPTRSVRENHAHVVHESSNFGDAGRAKAGGACKCGPLEREFSARSLPDGPDRSGCLSVVRQNDASGELDGRDQNHGVLQQACVARVTAARPRPHTSSRKQGFIGVKCAVSRRLSRAWLSLAVDGCASDQTKGRRLPCGQRFRCRSRW
jgi:hypothetical protein